MHFPSLRWYAGANAICGILVRMSDVARLWWQDGVIYQVYPRSFQDTNGDGVGDLAGILARLDHLVSLGIEAVWISPFYPSPMADFGYDVANYTGVDPLFGTLEDFDRLIDGVHERGLKLILDFVPNHTSDKHPWFIESMSSPKSNKRDWYLWRDAAPAAADGSTPPENRPPNNWMSHFGGPAWTWDEGSQQFYCHSFLKEQPDLNWRNPEVRKAIYDAMRFWLERGPGGRGVDGFRMDVLWLLIKDDKFRDNPPNPEWHPGDSSLWSVLPTYTADQPETHEIVGEMRSLLDSFGAVGDTKTPRVLIGEIYLPLPELVKYYGESGSGPGAGKLNGAQMPFNFQLIQTPWSAAAIESLIKQYEGLLPDGAWPNWVLGNHDQPRVASRIGTGAGPGCDDASADAAGHPDDVLRGRDRDAEWPHRVGSGARPGGEEPAGHRAGPRPGTDADACGNKSQECGVHDGNAVAPHRRGFLGPYGGVATTRPTVDPEPDEGISCG